MDRKLVKNYAFNMAYQALVLLLPLVTTPYVSRCLGVENIGIYSFTSSIVSYFVLFSTFSFNTYGQKEIAFNQNDEERRSQVFFEIQVRKAVLTVFALITYAVFIFIQAKYRVFYLIQFITVFSVFWDVSYFFQGMEKYEITVIRNAVVKMLGVVCIFLFVRDSGDLGVYIFIQCVSTLVGNLTLWPYLRKYVSARYFRKFSLTKNFRVIFELFIPTLSVQLYFTIDRTMLGLMCENTIESGYYEQALKIMRLCQTLITSFGAVLISGITRMMSRKEDEKIRETVLDCISIGLFLAVPMAFGLIAVSGYFTPIFFGTGYDKVPRILSILSVIIILSALSNVAGNAVLIPTGRHNYLTIATGAAALVNIILNSILIPRFMASGAAAASVISEMVVLIIEYYFARDYLCFKRIFVSLLKYILAGLIMFVSLKCISFFLADTLSDLQMTILLVVCGAAIYFAIMLIEKNPHLGRILAIGGFSRTRMH